MNYGHCVYHLTIQKICCFLSINALCVEYFTALLKLLSKSTEGFYDR